MEDTKNIFDNLFKTGKWSGHDKYSCTKCPFETIKHSKAIEHLSDHILERIPESNLMPEEQVTDISVTAEEKKLKEIDEAYEELEEE